MTNPRDPEGLMPGADVDGPPVTPEGDLPFDGTALDGGLDGDGLRDRTGDAGSGFGAGVVSDEAPRSSADE